MTSTAAPGVLVADRYRLDRHVGRGGVADVWAATDVLLERPVAVKVLRQGTDVDGVARWGDEARLAACVSHPHVLPVLDAGHGDAGAWIVMPLVDGRTLAELLPLPEAEVARIGAAVASALACVHGGGVVHRDVKPGNVLLDHAGHVWLSDFGIARMVDAAGATATGLVLGTAAYLAPEQVRGERATPAADVYALGLVLLEALTGRREYDGSPTEAALARLHREPSVPPDLPAPWPSLLTAMTHLSPGRRPTAWAVADALGAGAEALALAPSPAADATAAFPVSAPDVLPPAPPARRSPLLWAAASMCLLGVLGGALLLTGDGGGDSGGTGTSLRPAAVSGAALHHPGGSAGDDPQEIPRTFDGDLDSAWDSQRYRTAGFGGLRPGVGIVYDLGSAVAIGEVRLRTPLPGARVRIHAGSAADGLERSKALATTGAMPARWVVKPERVRARYWLVWFERLPEQGTRRAALSEVAFLRS